MHSIDISVNPMASVDLDLSLEEIETGAVAPRATATAMARPPVVTAVRSATVGAVVATAMADSYDPLWGGASAGFVTVVRATVFGLARVPVVSGDASVTAVRATSTSAAGLPITPFTASVTAVAPVSSTLARPPVISGEAVLTGGGPGTGSALAYVPVVTGAAGTMSFDAVGSGGSVIGSTTISGTHTASGSVRAVIVSLTVGAGAGGSFTGWTRTVTYGGVSMTSLGVRDSGDAGSGFVEMFGLLNPATGSQNIVINVAGPVLPNTLIFQSVSYTGVGTFGTAVTGISSGTPSLVVSSATGRRVIAAFNSGSGISGPTQTQRYLNNFDNGTSSGNLLIQDAAGAASVTFSATANGDFWGLVGVSLNP